MRQGYEGGIYNQSLMRVRITYISEVCLEANTAKEIEQLWDELDLDPASSESPPEGLVNYGFVEALNIEDAVTGADLSDKINL